MAPNPLYWQILKALGAPFTREQILKMYDRDAWSWINQNYTKLDDPGLPDVCFTGFGFAEKRELVVIAQIIGMVPVESAHSGLALLCTGSRPGRVQLEVAQAAGAAIVNEEEFMRDYVQPGLRGVGRSRAAGFESDPALKPSEPRAGSAEGARKEAKPDRGGRPPSSMDAGPAGEGSWKALGLFALGCAAVLLVGGLLVGSCVAEFFSEEPSAGEEESPSDGGASSRQAPK